MSDTPKKMQPVFASLIADHLATQVQLDILEQLVMKLAERLPASELDGLSPALWIADKKIKNIEAIMPYFPEEVRERLIKHIKEKGEVKKSIYWRREFSGEEGTE